MKYNLIPSGNKENSDIIYIYVLPASYEGFSYSIAYPDFKAEDILSRKIIIRTFDGCSQDALSEIEDKVKEILQKRHLKYVERLNTLFTAGVGVFILGVINWVIPDPLPLVDELLFTIGGGITAWKAWNDRKVKLPVLMEQTYRYSYEGGRPEVETDSILSAIFKSIRCKVDPLTAEEKIEGLDTIEIESLWMTRYLNPHDLVASEESSASSLEDLIRIIERVFPVKALVKMEGKKQSPKIRGRLQNIKQEVINKTGVSDDALAVYIEFYRINKTTEI